MAPVLVVLGLFLCFWGGKLIKPTLKIAAFVVGFSLGYLVGSRFENQAITWTIALAGALSFTLLVVLAFSAGIFILGALAGGVIYQGIESNFGSQLSLPVWGIIAAAAAGALLAAILQERVLAVLSAIVGGYLFVEAGSRVLGGQFIDWRESPEWAKPLYKDISWFIMTFTGMMTQRSELSRNGKD